jgi:peroxiredoxin
MNKKIKIVVFMLALVFLLASCQTNNSENADKQEDKTTQADTSSVEIDEGVLEDMKVDSSELSARELVLLNNINDVDMRDFTLPDFDGNEHSLSDYKGQIIILNFWAVGCPPCVNEMPDFNEVAKKEGVVLVTVAQKDILGNSKTESGEFISQYDTVALWDEDVSTMNIYPSQYYPHSYIIDGQGIIRFVINSADYELLSELVTFCDEVLN